MESDRICPSVSAYFSEHHVLKGHPWCSVCQDFLLFKSHPMRGPQFADPSFADGWTCLHLSAASTVGPAPSSLEDLLRGGAAGLHGACPLNSAAVSRACGAAGREACLSPSDTGVGEASRLTARLSGATLGRSICTDPTAAVY